MFDPSLRTEVAPVFPDGVDAVDGDVRDLYELHLGGGEVREMGEQGMMMKWVSEPARP